jgi:hypothetical protein
MKISKGTVFGEVEYTQNEDDSWSFRLTLAGSDGRPSCPAADLFTGFGFAPDLVGVPRCDPAE